MYSVNLDEIGAVVLPAYPSDESLDQCVPLTEWTGVGETKEEATNSERQPMIERTTAAYS